MTWKSQRHFSEEAFLHATFREFTKCWGSGKRARIFMESVNGGAFVSFSTFLGNPGAHHIDPRKSKMAARTSSHHDSQNGGNPHFQATSKKKSQRKIERDNARAAEFQKKKQKEEAEQATAAGKEKTARKEEEETKAASKEDKEAEEDEESEMMISSQVSSPESRKFIFASPVLETLRQDTSKDISMILDDERDETRQDEDDENIDDNLEGFREDIIDNSGDVEEDQEQGKDITPEPPPQPPPYRPSRPPIKLSSFGTRSFILRTFQRKLFIRRDLRKIVKLKSEEDYIHMSQGLIWSIGSTL